MFRPIAYALAAGLLLVAAVGCKRGSEQAASPQPAEATPPAAGATKNAKPARIVFVDQEKCCACTRKRIDSSWKALRAVLGAKANPPVERYHLDTQEMLAEEFLSKKPIVAAPGIYFLDQAGQLIELLQGEVTEAQIRAALSR